MNERRREKIRKRAFWTLSLLWLPGGMIAGEALRASSPESLMTPSPLAGLLLAAPLGLPLALSCRRLARLGYSGGACMAWAVLGACVAAGLLGPLPPGVQALLAPLPVWAAVWRLERRHRPRYDPWRLGPERRRSRGPFQTGR